MLACFFENIPGIKNNWEKVSSMFHDAAIPSKTTLLNQDEIADNIYFINKGCLRLWHNDDGKDITLQFFFEEQIVSSFESFYNHEPSLYNIETIEESDLTVISKDNFFILLKMFPDLNEFLLKTMATRFIHYNKLFLSRIKNSPQERYKELCKLEPKILKRVPHYYIASYLGITPVSLSRIRKKLN